MGTHRAPKYFDYLGAHGQYLVERFGIECEYESLEADFSHYRRVRSNEKQYYHSGTYLRILLEQMVKSILEDCPYDYGHGAGKMLRGGIKDGFIPSTPGYQMVSLCDTLNPAPHVVTYSRSELETALIQFDVVFRIILKSVGKPISGDAVEAGTDNVLLAHSSSLDEKAQQAAQLTGNEQLVEEGRKANRRAIAAERAAKEAREREAAVTRENEQLRIDFEIAMRDIDEKRSALSKKAAAYDALKAESDAMRQVILAHKAKEDAKAAKLERLQRVSDDRLAEAQELSRSKEAAMVKAAERVSELEEQYEKILNEHDYIRALLGNGGMATDEQRRVVNFPLPSARKSNLLKVVGAAGTGKTLCLLAAVINYLEPHGQRSMSYDAQVERHRALFICYNKDLAAYVRGLLEGFPGIRESIEVASCDQFLNQLIRTKPVKEYEHLARYARDKRFQPTTDESGNLRYWNLIVEDREKEELVRHAMSEVRGSYQIKGMQEYFNSPLLDERDDKRVAWMVEEIEWLEGRYHDFVEAHSLYPNASREGRGRYSKLDRGSIGRLIVLDVWEAYFKALRSKNLYTFEETVAFLLQSNYLPKYQIVAIDEAQDLNMMHVELFLKFRAAGGFVLIAGDERQKIYPKSFSWRQVDRSIKPYGMTLSVNKRNPEEIRRFADRLDGSSHAGGEVMPSVGSVVQVRCEPRESTAEYVRSLADRDNETTVVVTSDVGGWERMLRDVGVTTESSKRYNDSGRTIRMNGGSVRPGVYCFAQLKTKGLEFDNVIIDYARELDTQDEQREKRIRYMQFTRARKTLLVRYEDEPPKLLQEYYPDYLALSGWKKR